MLQISARHWPGGRQVGGRNHFENYPRTFSRSFDLLGRNWLYRQEIQFSMDHRSSGWDQQLFGRDPYYSITIALLYEGETIIGLTYYPAMDQMCSAAKGRGAFLNRASISNSEIDSCEYAVVSFIKGHLTAENAHQQSMAAEIETRLRELFRRTLSTWAPALDRTLVESGGIDTLVSFESEVEDQYVGTFIALEAGCRVAGFDGFPYDHSVCRIVATSPLAACCRTSLRLFWTG